MNTTLMYLINALLVLLVVRQIRERRLDPGPHVLAGAGGGHGLAAMRARAERAGGTARAGRAAEGWLVELEIPT